MKNHLVLKFRKWIACSEEVGILLISYAVLEFGHEDFFGHARV
jgi:hypothetical protein